LTKLLPVPSPRRDGAGSQRLTEDGLA